MSKQWIMYCIVLFQLAISSITSAAGNGVPIICYHDVGKTANNEYTITKDTLKNHLSYLKSNGYNPISLQQYTAFTKDGVPLPDKPVMITFDDGYISFYNEVFPLLKEYNYPAMLAIVGSWMEYAPSDVGKLVSWQQLREMDSSGLVSIASHSFRSHRFIPMNVQDDRGELLSTRIYNNGRFETEDEFKQRVADDLRQAQQQFEKELGHKASALVWPYGEYNLIAIDIAREMGFEATFTLGGGINRTGSEGLLEARRGIIMNNPSTSLLASFLKGGGLEDKPMRAAYLDIDSIYDPNSLRQTNNNLNLALNRFYKNGTNTVFLQTFSDEKNADNIPKAFFHTTAAPVKVDIFSHIASILRNNGFLVYAVMPSLLSQEFIKEDRAVQKRLIDLYTDLGSYAYVDGVLFQDDLYTSGTEEFSPAAKEMQDLTVQLMKAVRTYRPYALFARTIYPEIVLDNKKQEKYAQSYRSYLDTYDYTIIMTNPLNEKQNGDFAQRLGNLAQTALAEPGAAKKVVFKLNTFDVGRNVWIKDKELKEQIDALRGKGAVNFTYSPEYTLEDKVIK
ncbi:MAG: poly-beta-1,6-N-acetyl-D-glucosamine N-deacetylase PgaB [Sporomusaceae bacterium]|nr:poly-beta-1,6-N-acetyl-D-glucosamine N-deacetylase PgaB [Sporomusaceae bacterium]